MQKLLRALILHRNKKKKSEPVSTSIYGSDSQILTQLLFLAFSVQKSFLSKVSISDKSIN